MGFDANKILWDPENCPKSENITACTTDILSKIETSYKYLAIYVTGKEKRDEWHFVDNHKYSVEVTG